MLISDHTHVTRALGKMTVWRINTAFVLPLSRENINLLILSKFAYYYDF